MRCFLRAASRPTLLPVTHTHPALPAQDARQIEGLHIARYGRGDEFAPHQDVPGGPWTSSGFEASSRLVTVFVYLNDVARGGETRFLNTSVRIQPRRGTAVLFFPASADARFERDERLWHASAPAVDEKLTLNTFVWSRLGDREEFGWG